MTDLVDVHVVGVPVALQADASEHFEELAREFGHLVAGQDDAHLYVPERLLALRAELADRFSAFSQIQQDQLEAASERGDETIDLHYQVPAEVSDACIALQAMLDEADEYCAAGEYLLTLKTPPGLLAFRRWFLSQFVDQVAGGQPVAWADWPGRTA